MVFENYKYWGQNNISTIVPTVHFETGNKWCGELRYNYEDIETVSVFFGKSVKGGWELAYNLSPMAGYSFGRFTGLSAALNGELEWKSLYLSSQTQYSVSAKDQSADFFFHLVRTGV